MEGPLYLLGGHAFAEHRAGAALFSRVFGGALVAFSAAPVSSKKQKHSHGSAVFSSGQFRQGRSSASGPAPLLVHTAATAEPSSPSQAEAGWPSKTLTSCHLRALMVGAAAAEPRVMTAGEDEAGFEVHVQTICRVKGLLVACALAEPRVMTAGEDEAGFEFQERPRGPRGSTDQDAQLAIKDQCVFCCPFSAVCLLCYVRPRAGQAAHSYSTHAACCQGPPAHL